jgi:hypothetical protein
MMTSNASEPAAMEATVRRITSGRSAMKSMTLRLVVSWLSSVQGQATSQVPELGFQAALVTSPDRIGFGKSSYTS